MQPSRDIDFLPHDGPLREDVGRLGRLVGRMLAEQGGEDFYAQVETLRTAAIERRREGRPVDDLAALLRGQTAEQAEALARAFATYFQAVNTAERVHRIRRRRDYQREGAAPQPESLADTLAALQAQGVDAGELKAWFAKLDIEPVFTAHPTEAMRASLLEKEQAIVRALVDGFDPARTPQERDEDDARIFMALSAAWQTAEASAVQPTVQDEYEHVGFYLAHPLYRVVPALYESLEQAWRQLHGEPLDVPQLLRFATWVGGDMDGNPNVGADTIRASLAAQRAQVLGCYGEDAAALGRLLSQTESRVEVSAALRERVAGYRAAMPQVAATIRPRHADMPYRVLLAFVAARLAATREDAPHAYPDAGAFIDDLACLADSLAAHAGEHAGAYAVRRMLRRARTFGFHLARLDLRQDSRAHDDALAALFDDSDWRARDAAERSRLLRPYASGARRFKASDDDTAQATGAVFAAWRDCRARYGEAALGLYIISMARSAADVLAVLALARHGATEASVPPAPLPLDIAPLFETVDDLAHAPATLRSLLDDPVYRAHLAARGDRQWVMLGYSDSGKDGGTLASRWALQCAQVELLDVARGAGIALSFFHGRGGSASRGGARIGPALLSSPRGSVGGVLRLTEQGEVIHRKYGIRALALRNLEQTVGAVLRASLRPRADDSRDAAWRAMMDALSAHSRQRYRALVERENFVEYFRRATPIDVIERMTLGSRPSRRRSMRGVQDLRAIPWVFAWTQCRAILTGWYGLGSAIEHGVERYGLAAMREMARDWPFFANALNDVEMVLAKCDLDIAEAFSRLAGELHEGFFADIAGEFARACRGVLALKGQQALLDGEPRLALSIRLRNPYVDPMSLLQVDLLARWRAGGGEDEALFAALVACVNGVSQGLQNTG